MVRFVARRLVWAIPTIFLVTFIVYVAIRLGTDPLAGLVKVGADDGIESHTGEDAGDGSGVASDRREDQCGRGQGAVILSRIRYPSGADGSRQYRWARR